MIVEFVAIAAAWQWAGDTLPRLDVEQARTEYRMVHERIMDTHPDPFWYHSEAEWDDVLNRLLALEEGPTHVEHYFRLASLMGLAVDTHVQVYPDDDTPGFEQSYPLRLRVYEDGVYVTAAGDPYRDWVGARIVRINGREMNDIAGELAGYSFSDNPTRQYGFGAEHFLIHPATYAYFGLMSADGRVPMEIETRNGERRDVELYETIDAGFSDVLGSGSSEAYYWPEGWTTLDTISGAPVPLSRQHLDRNYWYEVIEDGRILYVQFNTSSDQENAPSFYRFTIDMFSDILAMETPPERIIVDARYNLGGWIGRSLPLAYMSVREPFCCGADGVVLLIGPETISAGSVFAGVMEIAANPIVIGQPTGGRPNIFLGHSPIELPYSGLQAEASTQHYLGTDTSDTRMQINPDILLPERFSDVISGRDVVLERAISLTPEDASGFYPEGSGLRPWTRPSQAGATRGE